MKNADDLNGFGIGTINYQEEHTGQNRRGSDAKSVRKCRSELNPRDQLHEPGSASSRDDSKSRRIEDRLTLGVRRHCQRGTRPPEIGVIENVEYLGSKAKFDTLFDREFAADCEVD